MKIRFKFYPLFTFKTWHWYMSKGYSTLSKQIFIDLENILEETAVLTRDNHLRENRHRFSTWVVCEEFFYRLKQTFKKL